MGAPLRCPRPAAGSGASRPQALLAEVLSVRFLAGAASPGAGAWHPAVDRAPPPHNKARATPARRRLYDGLDATQMGTCWRKCLSHFIMPEAGFLLQRPLPLSHPSLTDGAVSQVGRVLSHRQEGFYVWKATGLGHPPPPQQTPVTGICQLHGLPSVTCWALLNPPSQEEAGSG